MRIRSIDSVLIILLIVGGTLYVRSLNELRALQAEQTRIVAAVGDLKIANPNLMYTKALDTHALWDWSWHIYFPDKTNCTITETMGSGTSSTGISNDRQHVVARVAIHPTKHGAIGLFTRFKGGSTETHFGSPEFFEFLKQNRQQLIIEQFGAEAVATIQPGSPPVTFLKISLPDDLARQARDRFKDPNITPLIPVVFEAKLELK